MSEPTVPAEDQAIGERVRVIRRRRGLSIETTAGLAGINKGFLSRLERGERAFVRRGLLENLAAALGCSVADLTGQPYLSTDRDSQAAQAAIPEVAAALHDWTLAMPLRWTGATPSPTPDLCRQGFRTTCSTRFGGSWIATRSRSGR